MTVAPAPWAVETIGLCKAFGACVANRDVSLKVAVGSLHALVGENGAGKSTAVKMLYGMIKPDSGEIKLGGRVVRWRSPKDAIRAGVGMVHQHFMLGETLSGLDNILVGAEPVTRAARLLPPVLRPIDRDAARRTLLSLASTYGLDVDLDRPVGELPVGVQQRLEILKLLYRDAEVLILDEPTAVLTPAEIEGLFVNLRRLSAEGKTILVITHKLGEVMRFTDRATVLRRGEVVATVETAETSASALAELMVGRAVELQVAPPPPPVRQGMGLRVQDLTVRGGRGKARLDGVSFEVARGEILGVAGVEGNGQSELLRVLANPRRFFGGGLASGVLEVLGQDARSLRAAEVRALGMGLVPEDRHRQALVLSFSLTENFLLGHERTFSRAGLIDRRALLDRVQGAIRDFDVRPGEPNAAAGSLSGGNQQKLVIARELERAPALFIAAQPTRGVDVGSIEFIHKRILTARERGAAVLLVSSSLDEIRALADRIIVLSDGRVAGVFGRGEADEATIGEAMGGARRA